MTPGSAVLGVDPGRSKVGFAVLTPAGTVVTAGIEPIAGFAARLPDLLEGRGVQAIALGRGTNGAAVRALLEGSGLPVHWVDEYETSRNARALYFADHPPRGWRRLVPIGLQLPARPVDDYAAIAIARRYLAREAAGRPPS